MTSILDDSVVFPFKPIVIGESGAGKTGALASLVCAGYRLRIIDTDKGIAILKALLTNARYPYAAYCAARGIDIAKAVEFVHVDTPMSLKTTTMNVGHGRTKSEVILAPKNGNAWGKIVQAMEKWPDEPDEKLKHIENWDDSIIGVLDTLTTTAYMGFYFLQELNGHLGSREEGREYQRDIGGAQSQLRRLLEFISSSSVKCNFIINSHIRRIDVTRGFGENPAARAEAQAPVDPKGFPAAIGNALSPQIGVRFNDLFAVEQTGSGNNVRRRISTIPVNNTSTKTSTAFEPEYDVSTGLAEIFATYKGKQLPDDFLTSLKTKGATSGAGTGRKSALDEAGVS